MTARRSSTPTPDTPKARSRVLRDSSTVPDAVSPPSAPPSAVDAAVSLTEEVKKTLEYQLAGKLATVTVRGRTLVLKKWGLRKKISLGAKVGAILSRVQAYLPSDGGIDTEGLSATLHVALGVFVNDVVEVIAQSIEEPFATLHDAVEWLDSECQIEDILDLAVIVYDMNLAGDGLKNLVTGLDRVTDMVQSRLLKK